MGSNSLNFIIIIIIYCNGIQSSQVLKLLMQLVIMHFHQLFIRFDWEFEMELPTQPNRNSTALISAEYLIRAAVLTSVSYILHHQYNHLATRECYSIGMVWYARKENCQLHFNYNNYQPRRTRTASERTAERWVECCAVLR